MYTRNKQEKTKGKNIHQSENQGRNITTPAEKTVRDNSGKHRPHNAAHRTDGNDKARVQCGITFLSLKIENTPAVNRIAADIHESTAESKYPESRCYQFV